MTYLRSLFVSFALVLTLALPAGSQDTGADSSFLERLIQDALGGEGRDVQVIGLEGALSAEVRIAQVTIADTEGVWLALEDLRLDWNRLALLQRRLEVSQLSIARLHMLRRPLPADETPPRDADGFALPQLPVRVDVAALTLSELQLGPDILGQAADFALSGQAKLADGDGTLVLDIQRTDRPGDQIRIDTRYANVGRLLFLDLDIDEAAGGLLSSLAGIPDTPALTLDLHGIGPLSDFTATLNLATDGQPRLSGTVTATALADQPEATRVQADLGGDLSPLFVPRYRDFLGSDIALGLDFVQDPQTGSTLKRFDLTSRSLNLSAHGQIDAERQPQRISLSARIDDGTADPVTLPLPGQPILLDNAEIRLSYAAAQNGALDGRILLRGYRQADLVLDQGLIGLSGTLQTGANFQPQNLLADLTASLTGLDPDRATGPAPALDGDLSARLAYDRAAGTLALQDLALLGEGVSLNGTTEIEGLPDAPVVTVDGRLDAADLSRFAALAGRDIAGAFVGTVAARLDPGQSDRSLVLSGEARDLRLGVSALDPLLAGATALSADVNQSDAQVEISTLSLSNAQITVSATGDISGTELALDLTADLPEASLLSEQLSGPVTLRTTLNGADNLYALNSELDGAAIVDLLAHPVSVSGTARLSEDRNSARLPDITAIVGPLTLNGQADINGLQTDPALTGALTLEAETLAPFATLLNQDLSGALSAQADIALMTATDSLILSLTGIGENIALGIPAADNLLRNTTTLALSARRQAGTLTLDTLELANPQLEITGTATKSGTDGQARLNAVLADFSQFVAQLSGPLRLALSADQTDGAPWVLDLNAEAPEEIRLALKGPVSGAHQDLAVTAQVASLAPFTDQVPGGVIATGTLSGQSGTFNVDLDLKGPEAAQSALRGTAWSPEGRMDLALNGSLPLNLTDTLLAPRSLSGQARLDLNLTGTPGLDALSGTLSIDGARLSDPVLGQELQALAVNLEIAQSLATLRADARLATGGRLTLTGPVALTGPFDGDLVLGLDNLRVVDPTLYRIDLDGEITARGPLANGAEIAGRIDIDRAEITIPDSLGGGGPLPEITHVNESSQSRATRDKAGLVRKSTAQSSSVAYPLDLSINAPARIFVRGRGLDSEFGGSVTVSGTTAAPQPAGSFELIRGRLNILNRLLVFTDATISLGGDLRPDVNMVAVSQNAPIDARIAISGPLQDPELSFSSVPALPEDEVLSQLFFGKPVRELTPLELAGLASAISTLSGGSGGLLSRVRDTLGVDQLNIGTDDTGSASVTAGKYLSDNVFTDVTVNAEGESRLQLNYTVSPSITLRGGFDSTGESRIGIGLEKDY